MSKGLKVIFIISILLNFLFIGLTIGHFSKRAAYWGKMRAEIHETIGSLPEEKQQMIFGTMNELKRKTRGTKREVEKTRRELIETLTAENFDPVRFEEEARELHNLLGVLTMEMAYTVSELAQNLDREEREALSAFIEEMRRHRHRGGPPGMRRPGPPGPPGERF